MPYGAAGRLILLWLQTEALKTDTRVVRLGSSMYSWMRMMGTHAGGRKHKSIREQAMRIAACRLQFVWTGKSHGRSAVRFKKDAIVEEGMLFGDLHEDDPRQPRLWEDTVVLSRTFYEELKRHPVPIQLNAVQTIFRSSLAIDAYIWLAYRLRALEQRTHVGWASLRDQFGPQYSPHPRLQGPVHQGPADGALRLRGGQGRPRRAWAHPLPVAARRARAALQAGAAAAQRLSALQLAP